MPAKVGRQGRDGKSIRGQDGLETDTTYDPIDCGKMLDSLGGREWGVCFHAQKVKMQGCGLLRTGEYSQLALSSRAIYMPALRKKENRKKGG
jgi:hypothetical protein